ncbi:lantibiotic dehydratase C-terminal domain-containing protein [Myceligenerans salitolerans]|uniref:Thiopeptide-type bacteriocin biosynthesis domain-containing protein n=1 Tax=Myceligenerans salitolerans TaxID=1230528 RepID=A0ABS3IB50_9MICO|nr:lantibiotic dehydratase C-terminal domain-containing protein [Myceligenerans salitolerans]MBO0610215.1 hypothetical protein [Myceligenerans salitolerans]
MSARGWVCRHVFTTELDAVVTASGEALERHPEVEFFFIRHWNGGPHVRLRLRGRDHRAPGAEALRSVERALRDVLRSAPASPWPSPDAYARRTRPLGEAEGVPESEIKTLRRPNTCEPAEYTAETDKYGTGEVLDRCEAYFCRQSAMIARELRTRRDAPDGWRFAAALHLVTALLEVGRAPGADGRPAAEAAAPPRLGRDWNPLQADAAGRIAADVATAISVRRWGRRIGPRLAEDLVSLVREIGQDTPRRCGPHLVHTSINRLGIVPEQERRLWRLARSARDRRPSPAGRDIEGQGP